jgi:putative endonuclease
MPKQGYVYIITNKNKTTLYIGVTTDLRRRIYEHKNHLSVEGFSDRYNLECLVYYEVHDTVANAIFREKQMKKWLRSQKIKVINEFNPEWKDLSDQIIFGDSI